MPKDVVPPRVAALLEGGNKIAAIKELRSITGLGLKEAKDWIDSYERGVAAPLPEPAVAADGNVKASFTLTREALEALERGDKIEAIKIVREATGLGLEEAKDILDLVAVGASAKNPGHIATALESARFGSKKRPAPGQGLAPGEVPQSGGGAGKWLAVVVVAAIALAAAFYF